MTKSFFPFSSRTGFIQSINSVWCIEVRLLHLQIVFDTFTENPSLTLHNDVSKRAKILFLIFLMSIEIRDISRAVHHTLPPGPTQIASESLKRSAIEISNSGVDLLVNASLYHMSNAFSPYHTQKSKLNRWGEEPFKISCSPLFWQPPLLLSAAVCNAK